MDEAQIIDWYDIVEAVANGRLTGHRCPICEAETLNATLEHGRVRVACPGCGEGFEGRLSGGRDDGFYAEAGAMMSRRAAPAPAPVLVEAEGLAAMRAELEAARATLDALSARLEGDAAPAAAPPSPPPAVEARPAPWAWSITADQGGDRDYVDWVDIAQAIHNGHTTGHRCPYCSEPLEAIERRDPYIRVYCTVCGEGFEGKLA